MSTISEDLRSQILKTDRYRCCYCQTSEANSGVPLTFDHIHPRKLRTCLRLSNGLVSFHKRVSGW